MHAFYELHVDVHVVGQQPPFLGLFLFGAAFHVFQIRQPLSEQLFVFGTYLRKAGVRVPDESVAERTESELHEVSVVKNLRRNVCLHGEFLHIRRVHQVARLEVVVVEALAVGHVQ